MEFYTATSERSDDLVLSGEDEGSVTVEIRWPNTYHDCTLTRDQALAMADAIKRFYGEGE